MRVTSNPVYKLHHVIRKQAEAVWVERKDKGYGLWWGTKARCEAGKGEVKIRQRGCRKQDMAGYEAIRSEVNIRHRWGTKRAKVGYKAIKRGKN